MTGSSTRASTRTISSRATSPLIPLDDRRSTATATTSLAMQWRRMLGLFEMTLTNQDDYGVGRRSG
eukprot:4881725-Pyramimonas_sp.AAC.1